MTTLEQAKQMADGYKVVPISREILSDTVTPMEVLRILKGVSKHCYMLESVENQEVWGRYTFLGYDPKLEITCMNGEMCIRESGSEEGAKEPVAHPGAKIKEILKEYTSPKVKDLPSFTGGLVGYFSYDYVKYSEPKLNLDADDQEGFKDVDLMLFDKVIAFDNLRQKIYIIANARTENLEQEYDRCLAEIEEIVDLIEHGTPAQITPGKITSEFRPLFSEQEYCAMVEKAKHYIYEGDIFQVVLSNRLEADYEGSLFNAYRMLRTINPSPYMFYFSSDDIEVAGASPETLVKLEDGVLHTFPLAGTRPRGKNQEEDKALEEGLLKDEKELAEHNMLVDLARNDIGRIAKYGSVYLEDYMKIHRFSKVMHIASTVCGELREDKDSCDTVSALLPAGTLSGAPKFRACEIIDELEKEPRGVYGGAIGYIDLSGNLDVCIAIRTAVKKGNKVYVQAGAGIVADSVPESEYMKCAHKAGAVIDAIKRGSEVNK